MVKTPKWLSDGQQHVWHPYTQEKIAPAPLAVASTKGCKIKLEDGSELIDGISSWWSACHGYNHPHIRQAIEKQLKIMPHFMFAGTANEPAYILSQRLSKLTGLDRVFLTDSGSTAVETALKMAVQYWRNNGDRRRHKFISFKHGYHGDTMGCMSLCDPDNGMHKHVNDYMPKQYCIDLPRDEYAFTELDTLMEGLGNTVAAVIIEPLVQGAGGMKFHSADILAEIYRLTKKHGIIFIVDEIMTGFGRTGNMFACDEAAIMPDIMCVGKALTGGAMTLAATLTKEEIYEGFLGDDMDTALMSGPTFMANPLACAAANASLDLFETEPRIKQVEAIEAQLYKELKPLTKYSKVIDVRVKGAIGAVQVRAKSYDVLKLHEHFIKKGIWLRPFGDVIYVMPSFTISEEELSKINSEIEKVL